MRVVAYLRVSTTRQAEDGHGIDAQYAAIEREAKHRGWDVTWVKDAGWSGSRVDRPGLAYALSILESGQAEALVVSKLDRLGRTVSGLSTAIEHAQKYSYALVALDMGIDTTTSGGRMILRVLAALAEWERDVIRERTRDALAAAKAKGIVPGPKATHLPAATTEQITTLHEDGATLTAIAHALTTASVPLPSGRPGMWQPSQVRRVLDRACVDPR